MLKEHRFMRNPVTSAIKHIDILSTYFPQHNPYGLQDSYTEQQCILL